MSPRNAIPKYAILLGCSFKRGKLGTANAGRKPSENRSSKRTLRVIKPFPRNLNKSPGDPDRICHRLSSVLLRAHTCSPHHLPSCKFTTTFSFLKSVCKLLDPPGLSTFLSCDVPVQVIKLCAFSINHLPFYFINSIIKP
jgi:hypothetical protein